MLKMNEGKYRVTRFARDNKTVEDLGILTGKDVFFADHLDDFVLLSNVKAGLLL